MFPFTVKRTLLATLALSLFAFGDSNSTAGDKAGMAIKHGSYNSFDMYWVNRWWTNDEEKPEMVMDSGGVNPWMLINSASYNKDTSYEWTGLESGLTKFNIYTPVGTHDIVVDSVGNWGDQIDKEGPGAYVPTWRAGAQGAYSILFDGFGTYDPEFFEFAAEVGREFPYLNFGFGVHVDHMSDMKWAHARILAHEDHEIINSGRTDRKALPGWKEFYVGDTLPATADIPGPLQGLVVDKMTEAFTHDTLYVDLPYERYSESGEASVAYEKTHCMVRGYKSEVDSTWDSLQNKFDYHYTNSGYIGGSSSVWHPDSNFTMAGLRLYCTPGWYVNGESRGNIFQARDSINQNVYEHADYERWYGSCDFYSYGYGGNSEQVTATDSLIAAAYVGANGGKNCGVPTPGDFYHPFYMTYDNFDPRDATGEKIVGGDQKQRFGLNDLVDKIILSKGYMSRQFTICDGNEWFNEASVLAGTIRKELLRKHMEYLDDKVRRNELFVGTPSEIVKYRIMTDAVKGVELTQNDFGRYVLSVEMDSVSPQFQDEISIIVSLEEPMYDHVLAMYRSFSGDYNYLRYQPRKLDDEGYIWSISINPFIGDVEFGWFSPHVISAKESLLYKPTLQGITHNKVQLHLPQGEYEVQLCSMNGQLLRQKRVLSKGGIIDTTETGMLSKGIYLLLVKSSDKVVLQQKIIL